MKAEVYYVARMMPSDGVIAPSIDKILSGPHIAAYSAHAAMLAYRRWDTTPGGQITVVTQQIEVFE